MTHNDVRPAQMMTTRALDDLLARVQDPVWMGMPPPTEETLTAAEPRYRSFVDRDPDGSWVAETGGVVVGASLALLREDLWGLSLLMVDPAWQSSGVGGRLLSAALHYGRNANNGIIMSSPDARALRAYARAGFRLQPELAAYGPVAHTRIPAVTGVREGDVSDIRICDCADRHVRGAAHGADDIGVLLAHGNRMLVTDDDRGTGYVCVRDGEVALLAATTDDAASRLLFAALAITPEGKAARVTAMTGSQQWAINTVLECGLRLSHVTGAVLIRGNPGPMTPYLPNGAFL